jgi:activator of HSP90 ATPase
MKEIEQTYHIDASVEEVWSCFIDPTQIEAWGGGPAKMKEKEGEEFSLWGGDIHGTNTKVVKEKTLVQDWYGGKWDKPSKVTFTFHSDGDKTVVDLTQTDVPEDEVQSIADGWKEYYIGAMKQYLEKT